MWKWQNMYSLKIKHCHCYSHVAISLIPYHEQQQFCTSLTSQSLHLKMYCWNVPYPFMWNVNFNYRSNLKLPIIKIHTSPWSIRHVSAWTNHINILSKKNTFFLPWKKKIYNLLLSSLVWPKAYTGFVDASHHQWPSFPMLI